MKIDKGVLDKFWRLVLRSMPLVPGPELFDLVAQITRSQKDIDAQVTEALDSIQKTSALVAKLESSLKERADKLAKLQEQHDHLSKLTSIEAQKATALLKQVEETVGKHQAREHFIGFLIHLFAGVVLFVLGVVFSDTLKAWVKAAVAWF